MHRRVLAEVALEADGADTAVALVQPLDPCEGAVPRPVVDEDQLVRPAEGGEGGGRALVDLVDRPLLVEDGHDDREVGRRCALVKTSGRRRRASLRHLQENLTEPRVRRD